MNSKSPRVVVVTGVGRGLGRALALELTALGHQVHGCVRRADAVLKGQLAITGGSLAVVDTTDRVAVESWAVSLLNHVVPDLVINNAAVIHQNNLLENIAPEEVARVLAVNVGGVVNICRAFLPAMKRKSKGVIVNLSSGAGRMGLPQISVYCASKFAVEGLTKALAAELPHGMAAVAVSPGVVDTDMLRSTRGDAAANCPSPMLWARTAAPFFLNLSLKDNGASLTTL